MGRYIIRRLLYVLLVILVVSMITFGLMHAVPGGPFDKEKALPKEIIANLEKRYNLDKPLPIQYLNYLKDLAIPEFSKTKFSKSLEDDALFKFKIGDTFVKWVNFGPSYSSRSRTVNDMLKDQLPISIQLGFLAFMVALVVGMPLGILAALKQNTVVDYVCMALAIFGVSVPVIVLGPLLVWIFGVSGVRITQAALLVITLWILSIILLSLVKRPKLILLTSIGALFLLIFSPAIFGSDGTGLSKQLFEIKLPVTGWGSKPPFRFGFFPKKGGWEYWKYALMPMVGLGLSSSASIARLTRASLLQVIREDYIRTARAKGLRERAVVIKHALKNSLIPVITILGPMFAALLTGTFVTETIFGIAGMGRYFVNSITNRDYPVIMGTVLIYAIFLVFCNLIVDVIYGLLDPRIRYE